MKNKIIGCEISNAPKNKKESVGQGLALAVKKIASLLLAITMLFSITAGIELSAYAIEYEGKCGEYLSYDFDISTGEFKIFGSGNMYDYVDNSRTPWYQYCNKILKVTIGENVTKIGKNSFGYCQKLETVNFPEGITIIGERAFDYCYALQEVVLPTTIESIGDFSFYCGGKAGNLNKILIPKMNCSIFDKQYTISEKALVYGYENSTAEAYAKKYGREFRIIGSSSSNNSNLVTQHLILADLAYQIKDGDQGVKKSVSDYKGKAAIYNGSSVTKADLYNSSLVKDFKVMQVKDNSATGFNGAVLVNNTTKQIVFTFRGTTEFEDFLSDKSFAIDNKLDGQFDDALKLYNDFVKNNKPYIDAGYTITFTGHSLGGALAADMAVKTGYQCYSFNGACGHTVHLSYFANWINASKSFTGVSGMPITNYAVSPSEKSGNTATDLASNLIQNTNYDLIYTTNYALNNNLKDPNVCYKHDLYAMTSPTSSKSIEMNKSISQNSPKSNWKKDIDFKNLGLTVGAFLGVSLPMMPITSSAVLCGTGYFIGSMCNTGSVHLGETSNDVIKTSSLNPLKQYTRVIYGGDGDDQLFGSFGNDVLVSGNGNDTLTGYYGSDIYCLTDNSATVTINDSKGNDVVVIPNYPGTIDASCIKYISGTSNHATYKIGKLTIKFQKTKENHKLTFRNTDGEDAFAIDTQGNISGFSRFNLSRSDLQSSSNQSNYALVFNGLLTIDICDSNGKIVDTVTNADKNNLDCLIKDYGYIELYNDENQMIVVYLTDDSYDIKVRSDNKFDIEAGIYDENSTLCSTSDVNVVNTSNDVNIAFNGTQTSFTQNGKQIASNNKICSQTIEIDQSSIDLLESKTTQIKYDVYPTNADKSSIEYYSENPNVATVDSKGNVTAVSAGVTKIYASDQMNAVSDYITVNVLHKFTNHICEYCGNHDLPNNYPLINTDDSINVNIENEGEKQYIYFIPEESGNYVIESLGDYDTYGYLYDEDMNQIDCSDDSTYDSNFSMNAFLEKGKIYIIESRMFDENEIGSFSVKVEKHDHNYSRDYVAPTCTERGYSVYECACGDEYIDGYIEATGHKYKTTTTKATTKKNGSKVTKCSVCGSKKSSTTIYYPQTVTLSTTSYTYNGKAKKPSVTVKDSKGKKIAASNYTVSYQSGRKNVGTYTVTIKFKGNYSGTVKKTFTIKPKATTLSSVTAGKKKFTAKWKKQATQTTGYQIQYSTDKNFKKNNKSVTVSKNKTTSKAVSKLSAKKKYYVRIRTYKTVKVNGKSTKIYSAWSKSKSVTTKK